MNVARLEKLIEANEQSKDFDLAYWFQSPISAFLYLKGRNEECGTYGCLVGNYCLHHKVDLLQTKGTMILFGEVARHFDIPLRMAYWLFMEYETKGKLAIPSKQHPRNSIDKKAAINRVKKAIAYWKAKHEVQLNYEEARHSWDLHPVLAI